MPGWTAGRRRPAEGGRFDPRTPEGPTPRSEALLDRWVLARLNQVTADVTRELDETDIYSATQVVEAFLDDLTNWYVRRSRRRFWKSEHDADKNTAYATLYHVLVKLTRLLAPFTPFVTEAMYQNLVRQVRPEASEPPVGGEASEPPVGGAAYESIHHTDWPASRSGCGRSEADRRHGPGAAHCQPGPGSTRQRQPEGAPAAG